MKKRLVIKVYGLVQGVNFRYYTVEKAKRLQLSGWVKNEPDDSIKIAAEGEEERLKELVDWTKKGPPLARIDNTEIDWQEPLGEEGFKARYE